MNKKIFKIFIKNLIIFCVENYNKNMNKKLTVLMPLILAVTSCQITKVNLTYGYVHESDERDEVFSHEIRDFSAFENMNKNKESYIMYIYNDKHCMCYLTLKSISKNTVIENNILVYTMDLDVIENKNHYGYKSTNHSYPSICIFENGNCKYQLDYNDVTYFENEDKFREYIFERVNFSENY
jgi:hypothetical protein